MTPSSMLSRALFVILLAVPASSLADQCELVSSAAQVDWAVKHVKTSPVVLSFCKPCGDKVAKVLSVSSASRTVASGSFALTVVDAAGKPTQLDLAYTYVQVGESRFANLAKLVGCPATGVDDFITYNPNAATPSPALGKYSFTESCPPFFWAHEFVLSTTGASYSLMGNQADIHLKGSLIGASAAKTFVVEKSNVPGYSPGDKPFVLTPTTNGLLVTGVTAGCSAPSKAPVAFLNEAAIAAPPKKPPKYVK